MRRPRMLTALAILAFVCAAGLAEPLAAQTPTPPLPADVGDLSNAQFMIVKDSAGTIVLSGRLIRQPADGDEVEREGDLIGTGDFATAKGRAEVEVKQVGEHLEQEVELAVKGLPAKTTYAVFIDTKQIGTITTNDRGLGELELASPKAPVAAKPAPAAK